MANISEDYPTTAVPVMIMEIYWPEGTERFEFDVHNLSESTQFPRTVQYVDEEATDYYYRTTSTVNGLGEQLFEIAIRYEHAHNRGIEVAASWWGTTKIVLKQGDRAGQAHWYDAHHSENNCTHPFKIVADIDRDPRLLEAEFGERQIVKRTPAQSVTKAIPQFVIGREYRRSLDIRDRFGGSRQSGIAPSSVSNAIFLLRIQPVDATHS